MLTRPQVIGEPPRRWGERRTIPEYIMAGGGEEIVTVVETRSFEAKVR